jgi:RNA polymerase sigma-70 factor (sigma-E family)
VQVREPETTAFGDFVRARGPALLRTAHLLTGDRGAAEDLLQQALERLVRHWSRIDGDPEPWVRRTLVNLSTDRWRRRVRRPEQLDGRVPDLARDEDGFAVREQRWELVDMLRALPVGQRTVLVLRYFDELSEQETAEALGCSVGTVKSATSRALARLRELAPTAALEGDRT